MEQKNEKKNSGPRSFWATSVGLHLSKTAEFLKIGEKTVDEERTVDKSAIAKEMKVVLDRALVCWLYDLMEGNVMLGHGRNRFKEVYEAMLANPEEEKKLVKAVRKVRPGKKCLEISEKEKCKCDCFMDKFILGQSRIKIASHRNEGHYTMKEIAMIRLAVWKGAKKMWFDVLNEKFGKKPQEVDNGIEVAKPEDQKKVVGVTPMGWYKYVDEEVFLPKKKKKMAKKCSNFGPNSSWGENLLRFWKRPNLDKTAGIETEPQTDNEEGFETGNLEEQQDDGWIGIEKANVEEQTEAVRIAMLGIRRRWYFIIDKFFIILNRYHNQNVRMFYPDMSESGPKGLKSAIREKETPNEPVVLAVVARIEPKNDKKFACTNMLLYMEPRPKTYKYVNRSL